jgi:Na+/H+ antiporter NhaD/arsenite permease-like protein
MTRPGAALVDHPVVRAVLFERLLLTASAALALLALGLGRVRPAEIPELLDWRLLALFFVLTVAVELGKDSGLFDRLVAAAVRRAKNARALALALVAVTAALAALLTNDVALMLVVPFTMLLRRAAGFDPASIVVLEIASANVLGALTPVGNPQNLFLFTRGGFSPGGFFAAQLPFVAGAAVLLTAAVPAIVPSRRFPPPVSARAGVDAGLAAAFAVLLAAEIAALAGALPWPVPLALSLAGAVLLGRRLFEADFSLVFVFAFLFVGVAGLERGRVYRALDPSRLFGHAPTGIAVSGALLSQFVSNVPAALLLAPAVATPPGFRALLYGVNAGGCGTPIASIANLIGWQLYRRDGGSAVRFWRLFLPVSFVLLGALLLWSLAILRLPIG